MITTEMLTEVMQQFPSNSEGAMVINEFHQWVRDEYYSGRILPRWKVWGIVKEYLKEVHHLRLQA